MKNVSKNVFLNALVCPSLGWLLRSSEQIDELSAESLSVAERFRIEQGVEIGRRARGLYTEGVLISRTDLAMAAQETDKLMRNGASIIFEATFFVDSYVAKADILRKNGVGWHLIEVKSNVNDKAELLDDLAYTSMVINNAGFEISQASLLLISKNFRLGMNDRELFIEVDHTLDGSLRTEELKIYWDQIRDQTGSVYQPMPDILLQCKHCPLFYGCHGKDIENHILDIPRLSQKKFDQLKEMGIMRVEDIPQTFDLTVNQARVRECVATKQPWASESLKGELDCVQWPAFYLDFETVMTAIPLWAGIAPYTQIPTQYSIHKCSRVGNVTDHREFLGDPKKESRRDLAESLINDLQKEGSIVTYSSFEKTTINSLAQLHSDLSKELLALTDRIVDLEAIVRRNFYHPDFHGRTSVKVTLPVLVPEMSYDDLAIGDGDSASAAFAYLALGKYADEEEKEVKKNLLTYCAQDTMAMVKLHERLHNYES
jgi:hypothetical protein